MGRRITDKERKNIIADYIACQNYRETGRKNDVSYATVKRIVNESDMCVSQKIAQKAEQNTQDVLSFMETQHAQKIELLKDLLTAMGVKAKNPDMFTNIKDLATAYGILLDKELKIKELNPHGGSKDLKDDPLTESLKDLAGEMDGGE